MDTRGHFIAQFHLRNFKVSRGEVQSRLGKQQRKKPHVWKWTIATGKNDLVPVRDCAQQPDLYFQAPSGVTDPSDVDYTFDGLEVALGKVEKVVSPHFERLRRRGGKLDADGMGYIVEYIMIQFCRTPARLEAVSSATARAMEAALRANEARENFVPELIPMTLYDRDSIEGSTPRHSRVNEYVALQKRSCWGVTLGSVETLMRWCEYASWEVLWAPLDHPFVIGDDPVTMLNPLDPTGMHDGLAYPGTEFAMPISPQVAVRGQVFPNGTYIRFRHASSEDVATLNARQYFRAHEAVYSSGRIRPLPSPRNLAYRRTLP